MWHASTWAVQHVPVLLQTPDPIESNWQHQLDSMEGRKASKSVEMMDYPEEIYLVLCHGWTHHPLLPPTLLSVLPSPLTPDTQTREHNVGLDALCWRRWAVTCWEHCLGKWNKKIPCRWKTEVRSWGQIPAQPRLGSSLGYRWKSSPSSVTDCGNQEGSLGDWRQAEHGLETEGAGNGFKLAQSPELIWISSRLLMSFQPFASFVFECAF